MFYHWNSRECIFSIVKYVPTYLVTNKHLKYLSCHQRCYRRSCSGWFQVIRFRNQTWSKTNWNQEFGMYYIALHRWFSLREECNILRLACQSVCLSSQKISQKSRFKFHKKFLCMLSVAVARSFADGDNVICCISGCRPMGDVTFEHDKLVRCVLLWFAAWVDVTR